ncbi:hypothetical protein [Nocardioides sp.]|uniref:hypothetical protein n=1 Tax=Nocardioides sp. TaxID=35761 RepID=UPI003782E927
MRPSSRRTASLLAVPTLLIAGLVVSGGPASAAPAAAPDPAPRAAGADWLEHQLTDGLVHNDQFDIDDYGLSIDVGLALDAVGGHDDTVQAVGDAVAAHLGDYITGDAFGDTGSHYAGAAAKALWYAEVTGADPHSYGGVDLQQTVEDLVATDAPLTGRIQDVSQYGDSANVVGQVFAAEALTALGSDRAADVRSFLLQQQCSDGYFRLRFTKNTAREDQSCDGGSATASAPDTDVTATFVLAMHPFDADPAVASAVDEAVAWLSDQQRPNGSFGGGPTTEAPNANSTGLAGWALAETGDTAGAADAAAWVRAHQAANVGDCTAFRAADLGAVAYDNAARAALVDSRIEPATQDQFRRSTAQAVPVLAWAEEAGETHLLASPEYVKAGGRATVGVIGAAPGEALCARRLPSGATGVGWADEDGEGQLAVALPDRSGTYRVRAWDATGDIGTVQVNALAATDLRIGLKRKRIAPGRTQVLTVRGLAPAEVATVSITWPERGSSASGDGVAGQADDDGVLRVTVKVPRRPGTAKVEATGAFRNRAGATSFRVTR